MPLSIFRYRDLIGFVQYLVEARQEKESGNEGREESGSCWEGVRHE